MQPLTTSPSFRSIGAVVIVLTAMAFLVSGCSDGDSAPSRDRPENVPSVEIVQTRAGTLPLEQRLSGVVQARNQVIIYPEISGRVEDVFVDNGDDVRRGQPLARINPRQFEEQVRQAEAALRVQQAVVAQARAELRQLEAELARVEQLAERDFTSSTELERQRANVERAAAELERARAVADQAESTIRERREALSRTVVRSPVDGRVGRRSVEVGMQVDGSSSLFVVGDLSTMQVRVTLTEEMLSYIETGQRVAIRAERLGEGGMQAQVTRISPFLEAGSFTTEARIDVANPTGALAPGMYVDVDVFYGETEEATLIPNSALYEDPRTGRHGVFLAAELSPVHPDDGEIVLDLDAETRGPGPGLTDPTTIVFREVDVIARGRAATGVRGIRDGEWVVVVGHDLIDNDLDEEVQARVRGRDWDHIVGLQSLQQHDVLRRFMEKQQEVARLQQASS
jgi:HlyD family secretion protein